VSASAAVESAARSGRFLPRGWWRGRSPRPAWGG